MMFFYTSYICPPLVQNTNILLRRVNSRLLKLVPLHKQYLLLLLNLFSLLLLLRILFRLVKRQNPMLLQMSVIFATKSNIASLHALNLQIKRGTPLLSFSLDHPFSHPLIFQQLLQHLPFAHLVVMFCM